MNILITNVSTVKLHQGNVSEVEYKDGQDNTFQGRMTNEAPIKSIIKRLHSINERLDKIIYIESKKVREENISVDDKVMTHADFLRYFIDEYCNKNGYNRVPFVKDFDTVEISDSPNAKEVSESVFNVYKRVVELSKENDEVNVYIEANGGVRYVLSMLLSITKTIETQYDNVHIKEICSMVFSEKPILIRNTKPIFDTTQIVGIVDEYINYGRINSLNKYVNSLSNNIDGQIFHDIKEILSKLSQLSDDIQLCRTYKMLDDFYGEGGIVMSQTKSTKVQRENDNVGTRDTK